MSRVFTLKHKPRHVSAFKPRRWLKLSQPLYMTHKVFTAEHRHILRLLSHLPVSYYVKCEHNVLYRSLPLTYINSTAAQRTSSLNPTLATYSFLLGCYRTLTKVMNLQDVLLFLPAKVGKT